MTTEPGPDTRRLRDELERAILLGEPRLTAEQVALESGFDANRTRRLWRALGFPDPVDSAAFSYEDVEALKQLEVVASGLLGEDALIPMIRALGTTMARLADWQIANLTATLEQQGVAPDTLEGRLEFGIELVRNVAAPYDDLLVYAWRRHLAAVVARSPALAEDEGATAPATVGFADLVSFTALSNELGENAIGDLVETFESRCHDVIADHGGRMIKSLGDSVLFLADTPVGGMDIGLDLIRVVGRDARMPDLRVGIATGPVTQRMGDVFGPSVNLAARLTTVARRNRAIIDRTTANLLPVTEFETRVLPARPLRGFGDVEPVTVRRTGRGFLG